MNNFDDQHADGGSPAEMLHTSIQPHHQSVLTDNILMAVGARLGELPPRQKMTVEMAIKRLSPRIRKLLGSGYTNLEVVAELNKELRVFDLTVSTRTLTRYMPLKAHKTATKFAEKNC